MMFTGHEPHPIIPTLSEEEETLLGEKSGEEAVRDYYKGRAQLLELENYHPLKYGYEPPIWKAADDLITLFRENHPLGVMLLLVLGGNRAAKTEWAAKRVVQKLINKPGANIWCCQSTETSSQQNQQSVIWKYLPPELKPDSGKTRQGRITKVVYSQAGGFTENTLVLPNGSQCWFKFYAMKVTSLEGAELDLAWADELVTPDWLEALRYRLVTRNGVEMVTFTPVEGYSSTIKMLLEGARTTEETPAEMLPLEDSFEMVPRVQAINNPPLAGNIIYFHTADNPYGNYPVMRETLRGASRETILMRAYGVPTKSSAAQFRFRDTVHVMAMNRFAEMVKKYPNGTRYHLVDPCSGRPWFMGWAFCPLPGKMIFYREWPSHGHAAAYVEGVGDPGAWAVPGNAHDGERGPAQRPMHFGLDRYKQEILRVEGGEAIFERWMDCRYGNSALTEREGTTTLIEKMSEIGMDFVAMTGEKKILDTPDGSIDLINSALYYDVKVGLGEFSPELGRLNEPELLITENCPNMIYALQNWTGKDGMHGASKDPIDVLRGFYLSTLGYVGPEMLRVRGGGSY